MIIFFMVNCQKSKYSINLQPSIWEKEITFKTFKKYRKSWDFEIKSSLKYNTNNSEIKQSFFYQKK